MTTKVGSILRNYRREHSLLQKQAATNLGISRVHYSQLERGGQNPSLKMLARIHRMTGIAYDVLLQSSDPSDDDICTLCHSLPKSDGRVVHAIVKRLASR